MDDESKRLWNKQYRRLDTVQEQQEQDFLMQVYSSCYKRKFKTEPIFPVSNVHLTLMRDFRKLVGPKASELIETYFNMVDDWFIKQHYSLDCLIKNAGKVNAYFSSKMEHKALSGCMSIEAHCDSCWKAFPLTVKIGHDQNKLTRCPDCETKNLPCKKTTKKERHLANIKFGGAFLSLDSKK